MPTDPATHGPKYDCVPWVRVRNGKFVVEGDAAKPFTCWPGQTSAWSAPKAMSFQ